ncbi:uncharacterized protein LOC134273299 [Saccostrea cucullata]|uniref:uncharacterized protein LOC134273299 n=1 Tax=Saccostrea cuccullata TaxID=36930 RepID=UPI002ED28985
MAQSMTPRKTCLLGDMCIICGFSFVLIEKTADGKENIHKFYDTKLRLNKEREECIKKVTETSLDLGLESCTNAGICRKCWRSVESIIKTEEKNNAAKHKLRQSLDQVYRNHVLSLPSPRRKSITKRMLRSPDPPGDASRRAKSLVTVSYISPVKLTPFCEIGNKEVPQRCEMQRTINFNKCKCCCKPNRF